jgi:hypothetical protein
MSIGTFLILALVFGVVGIGLCLASGFGRGVYGKALWASGQFLVLGSLIFLASSAIAGLIRLLRGS